LESLRLGEDDLVPIVIEDLKNEVAVSPAGEILANFDGRESSRESSSSKNGDEIDEGGATTPLVSVQTSNTVAMELSIGGA
jgi:hypothetical protein